MNFDLAKALLFAALPPLTFLATIGAAEFKPDMPSPLGKMIARHIWQITAWTSLCTFLGYWASVDGKQWLAIAAALAAFPAYVALGTAAIFSRRAFARGEKKRR